MLWLETSTRTLALLAKSFFIGESRSFTQPENRPKVSIPAVVSPTSLVMPTKQPLQALVHHKSARGESAQNAETAPSRK